LHELGFLHRSKPLPALVWVHFEDLKDENVKMRQDSHVNEAVGKGSEEKKGKKMEGNFFGCFLEEKKPTPATQKHSPSSTRTNQVER